MLSLFSYNILRGKKLTKILEWYRLNRIQFDVICFQEYPEDKIKEFINLLPKNEYDYKFSPGFKFSPGLNNRHRIYGQVTVFNKTKLKLMSTRIVNLGTSKIEKRLFHNDVERSALITHFVYKEAPFLIANCHLTPLTFNKRRLNQLDLIFSHIRKDDIALIVGDFNYPSVRSSGLIKFMSDNDFENGTINLKTHKLFFIRQQLDYIFSKGCALEHSAIHSIKFSDHFPLVAQFNPEIHQ
jgi:endonuclease/exonuclease/phosphatase family metal-dependent hydrolase